MTFHRDLILLSLPHLTLLHLPSFPNHVTTSSPPPLFFRYNCKNRKILTWKKIKRAFSFPVRAKEVLLAHMHHLSQVTNCGAKSWQVGNLHKSLNKHNKKKGRLEGKSPFFEIECKSFPKPWWSWSASPTWEHEPGLNTRIDLCVRLFSAFSVITLFFLSHQRVMVDGSFGFSYKQRW